MVSFKNQFNEPQISEMPHMLVEREEFSLLLGSDKKLYAIGGYNN